jgi:hypothetical protein
MAVSNLVAASGGLTVGRFPIAAGQPFNIPSGLTLQHTVTSTTTYTAGQLPAQVWAVVVGGGGSGGVSNATQQSSGGGGGGIKIGWVDVPAAGITATIGAGGAARTSNNNGLRGGATVFGSVLVHGGGGGCMNGSGIFDMNAAIPLSEGLAGYGGGASQAFPAANQIGIFPNGAPFNAGSQGTFSITSGGGSTLSLNSNVISAFNNYVGGGAGGFGATPGQSTGGSGFTGGGGGNGSAGGSSSRDGGLTNTFLRGAGGGGSGGGGAGLLAIGSDGSGSGGGNGGSGGGGGGSGVTNQASGAGGNGCVLIYF